MESLVKQKGNLRLRVIDIDTWDSAVAQQHGIRRLPTLVLYRGTERISDDARDVLERIQREAP